ncbi:MULTISPECIES: hypothetical protein [Arthrobacter]|uniref:Uncharacterized protein n=1 Tax=Arthrobacter terricola TaxID=2547396 RepID=A0A4R5K7Q1_9MICC|nr:MULTISPECIES: hypothetical protein [Arthrobacter]MBT8163346.1 hypothetical protein [Arthrobacter sp. GN70]TDF90561.1 hypothetical protein E1809_22135 [Arthrobacter terricola]
MSILAAPKRGERHKKPDELLSSVVRETAVPAAVELLRGNGRFVFPSGTAWVILVLAAERIGGLSRKNRRDEAKGSIIELIEDDSIQTLATAAMLGEEVFGIIPTPRTLERMDEFGLLTGAAYSWAVVYQNEQSLQVDLVAEATFGDAQAVSSGTMPLEDAVGDVAWARHSGVGTSSAEAGLDAAPSVDAAIDGTSGDDGDPLFDESPEAGSDEAEPDFPYAFFEGEDEDDSPAVDDDVESLDDCDGISAAVDDSEPVAGQAQVRGTLARRFLSEDLDLQVTLDEFLVTFNLDAPTVRIDVPEGTGVWLGEQVAQLTRQANAQLAKLHADGETELQAQFVNLMGLHAEQVIREVSIDRVDSTYRRLADGAKQAYREELEKREEKARQAQAGIAQAFEQTIAQIGQQAADQAQIQYRERNKSRIQREQVDAAAAIDAKIENDYSYTRQEILGLRRKDAERKMAVGKTRIFEVLVERQQENLAAERTLLLDLTSGIQRIIDENRKNDISRAEALATEQATVDRVGALEHEHASIVERLRAEHGVSLRRSEEEFERSRKAAIEQMQARDEEWQHSLNLEKARTASQTARVADLLAQMDHMGSAFKKQYDDRVNELQADRATYVNDLERANTMQARSNKVLTALVVALSLLMAAAGFIAGALLVR